MRTLSWFVLVVPGCLWISAAEHADRTDVDGDGVPADKDCDDTQPGVYPGAVEKPCDQLDNDCDPGTPDGPIWVGAKAGGEGGPVTGTYETLEEALKLVQPGGLVGLCMGTFRERIVLDKDGVVLAGSGKPEQTVLDATGLGGAAIEVRAADVVIRQLTVTGGTGLEVAGLRYGGGISAMDARGDLSLHAIRLVDNEADYGGGLAWAGRGTLTLGEASAIEGNLGKVSGGGLYLAGETALEGVTISGNTAEQGGGLALVGAQLAGLGDGVLVRGNTAGQNGGGLLVEGGTVRDARFEDNLAVSGSGGGIFGSGDLYRVSVTGNEANHGGGIAASGDLRLFGDQISDNRATSGDGGGMIVLPGALATVGSEQEAKGSTTFRDNVASGMGGNLAVFGQLSMYGAELTGGLAQRGGGVALSGDECLDCTSTLEAVTFQGNAAPRGGGLWTSAPTDLFDCSFANNSAVQAGGALLVASDVNAVGLTALTNTSLTGGFALIEATGTLSARNGTIESSSAQEDGAAIRAEGAVSLKDISVSYSTCPGGALAIGRDGAALEGGSFALEAVTFSGNSAYDLSLGNGQFCDTAGTDVTGTCDSLLCGICELPLP